MDLILGALPPVGQVTAGALLAVVVLFILSGRLVPRQHLLDVMADRDHWRTSAEQNAAANEKLTASVEKLIVSAETTNRVLTEMQRATERGHRGDHP